MIAVAIRPYDLERDEQQVYDLWQSALGQVWPLSPATFHHISAGSSAYRPGDHLVACLGDEVIGFAGTQTKPISGAATPCGEIMVVMVAPSHRRKGVGRTLLEHALASLRQRGVAEVQVGGGSFSYFWPGVPANLPAAWAFFEACRWPYVESSYDLVRALRDYAMPLGLQERVRRQQVTIAPAGPEDVPALLAFEGQHFPNWLPYVELPVVHGDYGDVLLARDAHSAIVGTALVMAPRSAWWRDSFPWRQLLGENTGGIGSLGVMPEMRGRGIGLALAARATELLQERGVELSYVGWTWLVDWYGTLGYRVWREYRMSRTKLCAALCRAAYN